MGKILGFIGGFFAIVGIVAGLFIEYIAWYNAGTGIWVNAIGGGTVGIIASPIVILEFLPGVIAILGAILCLIPKKLTCLIGGLLVLIGAGLFLFGLTTNFSDFSVFWVSGTVHIGYGWMATVLGGLLGFIGTFVGEE
ncbi:MAG: hypothetical protein ACTSQ5_03190 [Promethearchaeota archaeon]